jgi:hypothetical protein
MWSKMYTGHHVNYPLFLSHFNETWIFSKDYRKIFRHQIFMKIRPFGSNVVPCGQSERWTDMTKIVVALRNFAKSGYKLANFFFPPQVITVHHPGTPMDICAPHLTTLLIYHVVIVSVKENVSLVAP